MKGTLQLDNIRPRPLGQVSTRTCSWSWSWSLSWSWSWSTWKGTLQLDSIKVKKVKVEGHLRKISDPFSLFCQEKKNIYYFLMKKENCYRNLKALNVKRKISGQKFSQWVRGGFWTANGFFSHEHPLPRSGVCRLGATRSA